MAYPAKITRDSILDEALRLIRLDGLEAFSMRELAAALGVRASSLYRHFPGRQDIESALSERATVELETRLRSALYGRTPLDRLRGAAWEYLRFSREDPALFSLLLAASTENGRLQGLFLDLAGAHTGRAVALWSMLHGYAILDEAGLFDDAALSGFINVMAALAAPPPQAMAAGA
jgi:AcrR family transcriptional regulator